MESYYSCNQGYPPWNPTPYQPHDLGYDAHQSYGFGDAYYGYEDPSPPYPPSQKRIEEVIHLLCQERKVIREIQEQIANQVDALCSLVIQWKTQSAINNSSSTSQPLNSEDRPSKSMSNPRGCIPTFFRCKGRKDTLSQPRIPTLFRCANQKEREDALLHEEDDESLTQEGMHECLEEVEEENKCQEAEDVNQEVEDKDKEQQEGKECSFCFI
ncbi:hypothetical protein PIB30_027166 [Stylosanthes scabra]|uniref:Uncharacterized protein n=1 Tax=Stylosanthes scabra TaxID=79078 RepID=A0ABU6QAH7_9FABA|nr:hypothetical protein [Stylosanthes scabra]